MHIVAYVRVSTDEQSLGIDAQLAAIHAWGASHEAEIVAVHEDHLSGGTPLDRRPGLLAAIDAVGEHRPAVLVVARRDRLARDVVAAAMIGRMVERAGGKVQTCDGVGNGSTPEDALMRTLVDAFAEYERSLIRARTRAALAVKRGRGERVGSIRYGTRLAADRVHVEPDEAEAGVVARACELRAGGLSLRAVARALDAEGHPSRSGTWHAQTVARIVGQAGRPGPAPLPVGTRAITRA